MMIKQIILTEGIPFEVKMNHPVYTKTEAVKDSLVYIFYAIPVAVLGKNLFTFSVRHPTPIIHDFKDNVLPFLITGNGQDCPAGKLTVVQTVNNCIFDWFLIFPMSWGVKGVAIETDISQTLLSGIHTAFGR